MVSGRSGVMTESERILDPAELEFLLEGGSAQAKATAPQDGLANQSVTMRGDLEQINLSDIFQTLAMSKLEGVLVVGNPLEQRQLYCKDGHIRLLVPPRVVKRRLGQLLVGAGIIAPEALRSALVEQRKTQEHLGQILVRNGLVAQEQVDELIDRQVTEDLFALFTWQHGTFEFYKGQVEDPQLLAAFQGCPEYDSNSLLLEVARRSDEWDSILEAIRSLEEIPRRVRQEQPSGRWVTAIHEAVFALADGRNSYRDCVDHTIFPLFDLARAARDLVTHEYVANVDDASLVAAANVQCELGAKKKALVILQTLRDRPGQRTVAILQRTAQTLRQLGESRAAGQVLLEAAQLTDDPALAIELARAARATSPRDAETISFLRTVLVAHGAANSEELEVVTLELLDALTDEGRVSTAFEILADARATGSAGPEILLREARLLHKNKQPSEAATVLVELGNHYRDTGNRARALEVYESAYRLDRTRKDIPKLLAALRKTRLGTLLRAAAALLCVVVLGSMGVAFYQQRAYESAQRAASSELDAHLVRNDLSGAKECLAGWRSALADTEALEDLERRLNFAVAAEANRRRQALRQVLVGQLEAAAADLQRGDLTNALARYREAATDDHAAEVQSVLNAKLGVLAEDLRKAEQRLAGLAPRLPDPFLSNAELAQTSERLRSAYAAPLARARGELVRLLAASPDLPGVSKERREDLQATLTACNAELESAETILAAYEAAIERGQRQRELDPLFQAAMAHEQAHDFAAALNLYRELEQRAPAEGSSRSHFRDMVARNAAIVRLLDSLRAATDAGDFDTAVQQLRALTLSFPEVPFADFVRLPIAVASLPAGAEVRVDGETLGKTPCHVAFVPAKQTKIELRLDGFGAESLTVAGDSRSSWTPTLTVEPSATLNLDAVSDTAIAGDADGRWFLTDRGGGITAFGRDGTSLWRHATGDLSGLLTAPIVLDDLVWVGSMDGDLRAYRRTDGQLVHRLNGLPTERSPVAAAGMVVLATRDGRLVAIDAADPLRRVERPLVDCRSNLATGDERILLIDGDALRCLQTRDLAPIWSEPLGQVAEATLAVADGVVFVRDDRRQVTAYAADGRSLWRREAAQDLVDGPTVVGGSVVLVTPSELIRFDRRTGAPQPAWPKLDGAWVRGLASTAKLLLAASADGYVQALDPTSGQRLYRLPGHRRGMNVRTVGDLLVLTAPDRRAWTFARLP